MAPGHRAAPRTRARRLRAPALAPLAVALVLLAGSLAGCTLFERRGSLTINVLVSDSGDINDFRVLNMSFYQVKLQAKSLSPDPVPSAVGKLELVSAARSGAEQTVFKQDVRADTYQRVTLTTPPGATFQGILQDGTTVAIVVPNGALSGITSFDVPRGGTVDYVLTVRVDKVNVGVGQPTYQVSADPDASKPK